MALFSKRHYLALAAELPQLTAFQGGTVRDRATLIYEIGLWLRRDNRHFDYDTFFNNVIEGIAEANSSPAPVGEL